jgi:hypothetical protein
MQQGIYHKKAQQYLMKQHGHLIKVCLSVEVCMRASLIARWRALLNKEYAIELMMPKFTHHFIVSSAH